LSKSDILERTSQIAQITQTSNHVITLIIIHLQHSLTVTINRTHKDTCSCENTHVCYCPW